MENTIVDTIMTLNDHCCHLKDEGSDDGLTAREARVLHSIAPGETLSSLEMARRNLLSPSRTSRIIDRLASLGFIKREPGDHDRRFNRVSLTPEGIDINKHTTAFKKRCESMIRSRLSESEFAVIQRALGLLQFALENEHGDNTTDSAEQH